jgi:hypothetical protein
MSRTRKNISFWHLDLTQDLTLARQVLNHLSHNSSPSCLIFQVGFSIFAQGPDPPSLDILCSWDHRPHHYTKASWLIWGLVTFLRGLSSNCELANVHLPRGWDHRCESPHLAPVICLRCLLLMLLLVRYS